MGLTVQILLPFFGGCLCLAAARLGRNAERWVAIASLLIPLLALGLTCLGGGSGRWIAEYRAAWAPSLGISIILDLDGLSALLLALSLVLGIVSVVISWNVRERSGLFNAALCWTVAASNGVFLSFDLLVFAFFWEAMLVPSFLLIALWGHGQREAAAIKFLVFNAVAGLGLLAAVFYLGATAATASFDAFALDSRHMAPTTQVWLLLGFALAFLVKLPLPPLHAWLPDAHTQAPTAGSILLAGLLLKTGAYGLFRFPPLLFPAGFLELAPFGLALGGFGAIYGSMLACAQTDAKRLVAYTSVAHMSIVLMGICGGRHFAMTGAAVQMIAHAFSASALFLLIGMVYDRVGTRDLRQLGGLQQTAPRFAAAFALFFSAALAMPGTANFLGESLVITGMFQGNWVYAALALVSLLIAVVYATRLLIAIIFGPPGPAAVRNDLSLGELAPVTVLAAGTIGFGLFPQLLILPLATAVNAAVASLDAVRP